MGSSHEPLTVRPAIATEFQAMPWASLGAFMGTRTCTDLPGSRLVLRTSTLIARTFSSDAGVSVQSLTHPEGAALCWPPWE